MVALSVNFLITKALNYGFRCASFKSEEHVSSFNQCQVWWSVCLGLWSLKSFTKCSFNSQIFICESSQWTYFFSWAENMNSGLGNTPGVVQLPALSIVILLQAFEPVCGLPQPGAVQQVLEGGWHIQVLVDGEGHAVVEIVEKVVRPLVDRAGWVVHGDLKSERQHSSQGLASDSFMKVSDSQWRCHRPRGGTGWRRQCASCWAQWPEQAVRSGPWGGPACRGCRGGCRTGRG